MAKKKASDEGFVMSRAVAAIIKDAPTLKGKEVVEQLKAQYPSEDINEKSALVAFSIARKNLGLGKSAKKKKAKARTVAKRAPKATAAPAKSAKPTASSSAAGLDGLKAARAYVQQVGTTAAAKSLLAELEGLQLSD